MNTVFSTAAQANRPSQEVKSGFTFIAPEKQSGEFELTFLTRLNSDETEQNGTSPYDSDSQAQFPADMLSLLARLLTPGQQDFTPADTGNKEIAAAGEGRLPSDPIFYAAQAADTWHLAMQEPLSQAADEGLPASLLSPDSQAQIENAPSFLPGSRQEVPLAPNIPKQETELADFAPSPAFSEAHTPSFAQGQDKESPKMPSSPPIPETKPARQSPDSSPGSDVNPTAHTLPFSGASLAADGAAGVSGSGAPQAEHVLVFRQIADHLERLVRLPGEDTIRIQLDPPELGALDITVRVQGNEVQAHVSAEQDWTRRMIEQTIEQLRQMVEERGLQLNQFHVNTGGAFQQKFEQDRLSPQDQQKEPASNTARSRVWEINPLGQWSVWV